MLYEVPPSWNPESCRLYFTFIEQANATQPVMADRYRLVWFGLSCMCSFQDVLLIQDDAATVTWTVSQAQVRLMSHMSDYS